MTKTINTARGAARKLGIAIVATGVFTITGGVAAPQNVNAFGIGDVFGVVEDVWEIGADATERVGRVVEDKIPAIGSGELTSNNPPRRRVSGTPTSGSGDRRVPEARGTTRPTGDRALPTPRGTSSSNALPTGDRALPKPRGTSSSNAQPTSDRRLPPARGESASGNSGTALPPPRRRNERIIVKIPQRPKPITEEDIKPNKPICNSKFQDCSGNNGGHGGHGHHGHHDHRGKKGKQSNKGKSKKSSSRNNKRSFNKQSFVRNFNHGSSKQRRNRR